MGARLSLVALLVLAGCSGAHINEPPTLADFTLQTAEDMPVSVTVDASDPEGDALLIELASPPTHARNAADRPAVR